MKAKQFATTAHKDHRYNQGPYTHHLEAVVEWVKRFTRSYKVVQAAWLHDVLEDCPAVTAAQLREEFGRETASMVIAMTDLPGNNRAARKRDAAERLASGGPGAILVKMCDRIANLSAAIEGRSEGYMKMYLAEGLEHFPPSSDPGVKAARHILKSLPTALEAQRDTGDALPADFGARLMDAVDLSLLLTAFGWLLQDIPVTSMDRMDDMLTDCQFEVEVILRRVTDQVGPGHHPATLTCAATGRWTVTNTVMEFNVPHSTRKAALRAWLRLTAEMVRQQVPDDDLNIWLERL